ncbi:polysaccharide deacetylase family protein [Micromonospora sp. NBC_00617]|uniref:polysaccharide deacetylase family protein n=1 Tax=Micromonospora sp. NBC_00617 TaxID=2903587 RepID=UPI0030E38DDB
MRYAAVAWGADGYQVAVVDEHGRQPVELVLFGRGRLAALVAYVRTTAGSAVVDSTNGIVDGQLMAAGLPVYRADPHVLPPRPGFGSVPAIDIARAAQRDLSALTRLERHRGTQTGREDELAAVIARSEPALAAATAAGRCLSHGDRARPEVALTFDDGPQPPYTGQVLDVLERYGVPATFFSVGLHAGGHPDELVRMREQGHQVGNHTWSHPFLQELSRTELADQVQRAGEAVATASGGPVPSCFRPPYGSRTPQVIGWLRELDPTVVLWDAEAEDWAMPGADVIARRILDRARPGSVILLHDGGGDRSQTVAALPPIIEGLLARGYRFVPVEALTPPVSSPSSVSIAIV